MNTAQLVEKLAKKTGLAKKKFGNPADTILLSG